MQSPVFILGDVTNELHRENSSTNNYFDSIQWNGFSQNVVEPTRVTNLVKPSWTMYFSTMSRPTCKLMWRKLIRLTFLHLEKIINEDMSYRSFNVDCKVLYTFEAQMNNIQFRSTPSTNWNGLDFSQDLKTITNLCKNILPY